MKTESYWVCVPPVVTFEMTPKQKWKAQESARRYFRRYGSPKPLFTGEVGWYDGFRIITS